MTITVNQSIISDEAIDLEAAQHPDAPDAQLAARYTLAVRELLLQRAREVGLRAEGDNASGDEALDALLEREVITPVPTDDECRRYYETHAGLFRSGDLVEASHILFAVTPNAPVNEIRATAEATLKTIVAEPQRFAELAGSHSNCPSGAQGGNLGQLKRGDTVPEFEAALFEGTAQGVVPRLVNTRYGFHVVHVAHRVDGKQLPFEMAKDQIAEYLSDQVQRNAMRQYVQILAGKAKISGIDLGAADSPLVR
ncbi:MAG: peptidylprolyl isomerase [Burkholderiales bacterium]|nr:peptidylprolyl isomerase [Burkholderiales bacterium]